MSGQWPPEWEDADDVFPAGADQSDTEADPRLAEVSAYLASVPAPVLPDSVRARVSAALAAETATRAAGHLPGEASRQTDDAQTDGITNADDVTQSDGTDPADNRAGSGTPPDSRPPGSPALASRPAGTAPARARVRRRPRLPRTGVMAGTLVAVLIFAGLGWAISLGHSQSSSSYSSAAGAPVAGSASSAASSGSSAAPDSGASASSGAASAVRPGATPLAPVDPAHTPLFTVTESGTAYRKTTLTAQVRAQEASATGTARFTPTSPLLSCVLHFTGGALPHLVDRATYQGTAAYVIASSSRVWVVGLGCTAVKPELVVSVPLAG